VFTSDNGTTHLKEEVDYDFFDSVGELRGLKGSLYEGGIRVPLIVKWPGKIAAGSNSSLVTGLEDWLPTIADLIDQTSSVPQGLDGISVAPTLLGKPQEEREFMYREFSGYGGQQAVWMGPWKGVRQNLLRKNNMNPLEIELYNLDKDANESKNVAAAHPQVVEQIRQLMKNQHTASEWYPIPILDN
jgi:arylsulfatase A